jgi:hypothetical protein
MAKDAVRNWWSRLVAKFGGWLVWKASVARGGFVYIPGWMGKEAEYVPQENVLFFLMKLVMELEGARLAHNAESSPANLARYEMASVYLANVVEQMAATIRLGLVGQSQVAELVMRAAMHRMASPRPEGRVVQPEQTFSMTQPVGEKISAEDAKTWAEINMPRKHDKLPVEE